MRKLIERVKSSLFSSALHPDSTKWLVAVSGGIDSMALLHVLTELNMNVTVAHVNYGLRGEESDADAQFVSTYCLENGLPCFVLGAKDKPKLTGESVQMWARRIRYEWFDSLMELNGYDALATAHHLDDSFETILLNLVRGTGIAGVAGIPVIDGKIVRPLAEVSRQEIMAYAQAHQLRWREDSSNAKLTYDRNKIRHQVIPILKELNPALDETLESTLRRLRGANDIIHQQIDHLRENYLHEGEPHRLEMDWFTGSLAEEVLLWEMLKHFGFNYDQVQDMVASLQSGKQFYSTHYELTVDRSALFIQKRKEPFSEQIEISSAGIFEWGDFTIEVSQPSRSLISIPSDNLQFVADKSKLTFPIQVSSWQEGEWFYPLGMRGKKKLSDFMIDRKIPLTLKKKIPVFRSDQEVVWLGGLRPDDRFKITEKTKEVVQITLKCRDKAIQEVLYRERTQAH